MKKESHLPHEPTELEIQHQAYLLWAEGGCRTGGELDDWLAAKELLRHRHGHSSTRGKSKPATSQHASAT